MNKLDLLPDRALDLASQAGTALRAMGPKASTLINAGAKLGAARAGARMGLAVVRRNPVIAVATIAGAGLLWYVAKRRAARAENGQGSTIEGSARRVDARRNEGETSGQAKGGRRSAGTRTRRASTGTRTRSRGAAETRTEH